MKKKMDAARGNPRTFCPFCGYDRTEEDEDLKKPMVIRTKNRRWCVQCPNCKARGPEELSEDDALIKWEHRSFISVKKVDEMHDGIDRGMAMKPFLIENEHFHIWDGSECSCGIKKRIYMNTNKAMLPMVPCSDFKGKLPEIDLEKFRKEKKAAHEKRLRELKADAGKELTEDHGRIEMDLDDGEPF